jgi:hypothetical protein
VQVLDTLEDITVDAPQAPDRFALLLAEAIAADCVPFSFFENVLVANKSLVEQGFAKRIFGEVCASFYLQKHKKLYLDLVFFFFFGLETWSHLPLPVALHVQVSTPVPVFVPIRVR